MPFTALPAATAATATTASDAATATAASLLHPLTAHVPWLLSGTIPATLGEIAGLELLHLHHNALSGSIPSSLGNLQQMQELALHTNQLTSSIPASLGSRRGQCSQQCPNTPLNGRQCLSLTNLVLYSNLLSGTLPPEVRCALCLVPCAL